jgi:adenylate cyclase
MPDEAPAGGMQRKLAALLSTDVAGDSRLMGEDEEATIRTLTACRSVISSLIQQYRGRVVDSPGDNLLAEFASVVDAVRCAVEIQYALKVKNEELPSIARCAFALALTWGMSLSKASGCMAMGQHCRVRLKRRSTKGSRRNPTP